MLNKHIIGELMEIAQNYEGVYFNYTKQTRYEEIVLCAENNKLMILHYLDDKDYSIIVKDNVYTHLNLQTKKQALELLYFLKETYDNCKEYPDAFHNALKQMCYKYKKEMEMN